MYKDDHIAPMKYILGLSSIRSRWLTQVMNVIGDIHYSVNTDM